MSSNLTIEKFWNALARNVDQHTLEKVERLSQSSGEPVPAIISQLGILSDDALIHIYESDFDFVRAELSVLPETPIRTDTLNTSFLKSSKLIPLAEDETSIDIAMVDPLNPTSTSGIQFALGKAVNPFVISLSDWRSGFDRLYPSDKNSDIESSDHGHMLASWTNDTTRMQDHASEAPAIRQVEDLLQDAVDKGASDIHVEPAPNATRIRLRIDGEMQRHTNLPSQTSSQITSRIKVLCDMDVADSRRPQDGRTSTAIRGRPVDLRVSTVPTAYGESLAIRILDRTTSLLEMETLGFSIRDLDMIISALQNPKGIFLVTGPTGSGKTTTLYAALNRLKKQSHKILTIENPIEYFFDDINQVQVNEGAGVTFSTALRSFLRQDPDIIMVGEIRDAETARIAVQAALTGHLVLSTLHTNDALSCIDRLRDLGVENYLIAATLSGVVAQRLIRRLCGSCLKPVKQSMASNFKPVGCEACNHLGFNGRVVIAESFSCTPDLATVIRENGSKDVLEDALNTQGFKAMLEDGREKAAKGLVTIESVYAAIGHIHE